MLKVHATTTSIDLHLLQSVDLLKQFGADSFLL